MLPKAPLLVLDLNNEVKVFTHHDPYPSNALLGNDDQDLSETVKQAREASTRRVATNGLDPSSDWAEGLSLQLSNQRLRGAERFPHTSQPGVYTLSLEAHGEAIKSKLDLNDNNHEVRLGLGRLSVDHSSAFVPVVFSLYSSRDTGAAEVQREARILSHHGALQGTVLPRFFGTWAIKRPEREPAYLMIKEHIPVTVAKVAKSVDYKSPAVGRWHLALSKAFDRLHKHDITHLATSVETMGIRGVPAREDGNYNVADPGNTQICLLDFTAAMDRGDMQYNRASGPAWAKYITGVMRNTDRRLRPKQAPRPNYADPYHPYYA